MDAITKLMHRAQQSREKNARRKQILKEFKAHRSRFQLEPFEPRLLLSSTPIAVTQFVADASGFTAHFNQAVDATVLNLYYTEAGVAGPADVTVVGASQGAVKGSLVVNGDQLTFIKTGGALAPDVYTVTMRSASNGIKGTDGTLLDGNSDGTGGDNYVHAFTVDSIAGPTVGIADFARGPGQAIQVPAPNNGIPISISDGSGVTSVEVTLQYDPSLLTIIGVVPGADLPTGSAVLPDLTVSGTLTLQVSSPTALASGPLELVRLVSEVPHTATYGATGLLEIGNLSINHGNMAAIADDGVEAVVYFGDATGNKSYSSLDGSRILRVVAGLDSGYAAYPFIDPVLTTDITGNGVLSALDATRVLQEVVGLDRPEIEAITPVIQMQLADDTGASSTDKVTFDPTVSGTARDDGSIATLKARVDTSSSIDVTSDLINGTFTFSRARLEEILGGPLGDGTHTLNLQAIDNGGNVSTVSSFSFTLDATPPTITAFNLSAGSDTGTPGDNVTAAENVLLTGTSEAGAKLLLNTIPILAGAGGVFQIPDVDLVPGQNIFTLNATDLAGNTAQGTLTVNRIGTVTTDVALQWNQQALEAIRLTAMDPPLAARVLAMVSLAQYDTLAAIDGRPAYLIHQTVTGPISVDAALAKAAHTVLYALFPSQRAAFDTVLNTLLGTIADGPAKTNALALGLSIGSGIVSVRSNDGSDAFVDYPGSTDPGMWRPDAPMFDTASEPQWGDVVPFALSSGDEFRPDAPPALDSAEYAQSVNEIESLGSATSSTRTADETQIAQFWADGKGSYTPVGHWDQIAQQIALSQGNSLSSNVLLFAELNVAMADSGIAAWDTKYSFGLWRPIDAIQNADQDGNSATIADPNWTPLLITPSFPEYVSGHSTFSAAAAEILAATFGDNTAFSTTAFTLPGVTRSFTSFTEAAQEAGRSRIYGGIHYEFSNQAGQQLGQKVAAAVLDRFVVNQDVQPPSIIAEPTPAATNANVTLTGQILDNLSGVSETKFQIDSGAFQSLSLDSQGRFAVTTALALNGTSDGTHSITIQAEDAAGNSAPLLTRSFVLDTQLPSIALDSIASNSTIDASSQLTGAANPTGSNLVALNYNLDNNAPRPLIFDPDTGSFNETIELGNLGVGNHTVTITAQDAAGNQAILIRNVTLAAATPLNIVGISPDDGAGSVGSTFRPQVFFSKSIRSADLSVSNFFATDSAGRTLAATIVPAQDGTFAWLFFTNPMPGAETITIHVDGSTIHSQDGTQLLDADRDGTGGGLLQYSFTTVSLAPIPGTTLTGRVVDPGPDLLPMTFDDIRRGPDGIIDTPDDVFLNPIAGAKVFIPGRESEFVITDAAGRFTLTNVPAGDVKLVIDGRTATNAPAGFYFPEMVMDLTIEPGLPNTVMGSMGTPEEQQANESRDEVYLPRLAQSILQTVSSSQDTIIGVDANSSPNLTDAERAEMKLVVQPGSLLDANGNPVINGQVGISTVPSELVKDMLPPGLLQHTFDITIQAPGVAVFNTPLQITFPNTFNAAPGTKLNFLSFDHTTGRLVIEGTATVSADGLSVTTDPGEGITKPGWHGVTPPGNTAKTGKFRIKTKSAASGVRGSDLTEALYRFDFGTTTSPVAAGYTRITPADVFSDSVGYGWDLAPGQSVEAVDRANSGSGDLNRDFNATQNGTFVVNVPDGFYAVTITLGDSSAAHNQMGVYEQSILVNNVTTRAGEFIKNLYVFPVTGGKMLLNFAGLVSGTDPVAITSIEIQPVDDEPFSPNPAPPPLVDRLFYYAYDNLDTGFVTRGSAMSLQEISNNVFFAPNSRYLQFIFDPKTMTISSSAFTTPASGVQVELPDVLLEPPYTQDFAEYVVLDGKEPPLGGDSDGDGLSDDMEFVIGTNPHQWSTANDGISDRERVLQGLDPSGGRAVPTGIVGSLALKGEAKAVAIEGGATTSETQTAYVATGSYGLAIVNVSQFKTPVVLSQLDLPGNAVDVSVDPSLKIAAVASDDSGLYLVDVSNPQAPVLLRTINAMTNQVEVVDGVVYAAVSSELRAYDMLTGERLDTLTVSGGNITTLAREGSMLYTTDSAGVLLAIDLSSGFMVARGSLTLPVTPSKLFVGGGIAYVAATSGFATVNVSNPNSLVLLSGPDATNLAVTAIAANGSGLAVSIGSPRGLGNLVEIFDVSNPTVTDGFLTQYALPAIPFDIAIGGGLAFVADGSGGLVIVNYRSFDTQGVAPVVSAQAQVTDLDPVTPGIQVQEGTTIQVSAVITDDVQARNAELLFNGQAIQNDLSFPFDWFLNLPSIAANGSDTVTVQVRATDTGGNVGLSNLITLKLVPDTIAPTIASINPPDGGTRGQAFRTLLINFSEAMDESTLTASNIQLTGPGGVVTPAEIQIRNNGRSVQFTYASLVQGAQTISIKRDKVKDRAGNAMGTGTFTSSFTVVQATAVFTNAAGTGFWDQAANWENNVLPTATDDVLLDFPGGGSVVFRTGSATIRSLTSAKPFTITGGTLTVLQTVQVNNTFTLAGGTLKDATIIAGTGGQGLTASPSGGTLRGVALNVNSTINNGQALNVSNGLILNAVLTLAGTGAATTLAFTSGTQTLGGTGTIVMTSTGSGNQILLSPTGGTTLTVGSGIRIHGKGTITQNSGSTLINNGAISADVSAQALTLNISVLTNNAVLEAINGATLSIATTSWSNAATGTVTATNSTLSITGTWSNANTITVNNSTLNLGGTFATAGMGTINRTGGVVNLTGTLTNSGLLLNAVTGSWNLLGGTIVGGAIAFADGATLVTTASSGTLNGVALNSDLTIVNGTGFGVSNGLTLNAVLTLASTGAATSLAFISGTQTLGGTGTIALTAGSTNVIQLATGGITTLTVGSGIRIHGKGLITQSSSPNTLINNGTISADVSGQTLTMSMSTFTNNAVAEAINGATLSIATGAWSNTATGTITATNSTLSVAGTWSNANTITVNNSTLNLGGTFTTGGMGTINRIGGAVNLTGTLTNSGLLLNAVTGSWNLLGGTIVGGAIAFADGASLVTTASSGTLNGVTLNSDLTIVNGTGFGISNGLTLNAVLTLASTGAATTLAFISGTQILGGTGTIALTAGSTNVIQLATGGITTLTVGSGIHIHGKGLITQSSSPNTLINNGTISADVSGQTLTLSMSTFTNNAVAEAINGATLSIATGAWSNAATGTITATNSTLSVAGTWTNANTITVNNSTLNLGGTFTTAGMGTINRTGGTVNLTGTLTSSGLLLNAVTGSWNLLGGTIIGGTIAFADGASLVTTASSGTLNGVTLNSDLTIANGTGFGVSNGLTLNAALTLAGTGTATSLAFTSGTQTLGGTGTIVMTAAGSGNQILLSTVGTTTVTVGSGIHIHGKGTITQFSAGSTLINNGTISADVSGQPLTLSMSVFTNNAVVEAINGATLSIATGAWSNAATGTITATNSTLSVAGTWTNANTITVNNSTLNLGGTFATAGMGTINRTGGTVNLTGTLTSSGLLLNAVTGSWNLLGGTIIGGTIAFADGASLVTTASSGTLNGVTLNSDLTIANGTGFGVSNGLTLNAALTLAGTGTATSLAFTSGTQTLGGTGTIVMTAAGSGNQILLSTVGTTTVTVGSGIHIHGKGTITQFSAGSTLINNGTISADVSGQPLTLSMSVFTNNAVVEAINGATLSIATGSWSNTATGTITATNSTLSVSGTWSNANTITVNNSTLNLGGTFTTAGMGTINRTGGIVNLTGTLTSSGLLLNAATGSWNLLGGTIIGGTIAFADGASLVTTASSGTLNGVTLNSDLTITNGTGFGVSNGMTLNAVLTLAGTGTATSLAFTSGTQTLGGTGTIVMTAAGSGNQILLSTVGTTTVTVGSGIHIHGKGTITQFSAGSTLINNGTISADVSGQPLTLSMSVFTNNAVVEAINGATLSIATGSWSNTATGTITATNSTLSVSGTWSNANTITVNNSTLNLGGTFTTAGMGAINRTGGTVNLTGTLTSSGLLLNAVTGSWNLLGGTIIGGTIAFADGASLVTTASSGTLNGVTLNSDLTITNGTGFGVSNGMTLNAVLTLAGTGTATSLAFTSGTQTLGGTGTIVMTAAGSGNQILLSTVGTTTVTVGSGIHIHGKGTITQFSAGSTLINNGTISADVSGQTLTVSLSVFSNVGTIEAINGGTLNITGGYTQTAGTTRLAGGNLGGGGTINLQGGTLTGSGTITANVTNSALIEVGGPGATGTLNITGNYTQTALGTLRMEIAGLTAGTQFDLFVISGSATLAGTLNLLFIGGFDPAIGNTFQIMTFASRVSQFANVTATGLAGGKTLNLIYNAANITASIS